MKRVQRDHQRDRVPDEVIAMTELIEDYCRKCGERFDPAIGCRCSLIEISEPMLIEPVLSSIRDPHNNVELSILFDD